MIHKIIYPAALSVFAAARVFAVSTGETLYSVNTARDAALAGSAVSSLYPQMDSFFNSENLSVTNSELEWNTSCRRIDYARPGKIAPCISIIQFQSASSDVLDELNNSGGSFRQDETLLRISAAAFSEHFSGTLSFDYMKQKIYGFSGDAYGAGAAVGWMPFGKEIIRKERVYLPLNIGFAAQNVKASELDTGDESEPLPVNCHIFANTNLLNGGLCLYAKKSLMDADLRKEPRTALGVELWMSDELVLRAGKDDLSITAGAGMAFGRFFLDVTAVNGEGGNRMALTAGFKFSYIASISEKIIAEKKAEIKKLMKEIAVLKDSSSAMTDEERDWLIKMLAEVHEAIQLQNYSKAGDIIKNIFARYETALKGQRPKLTKSGARKLAGKAKGYMEQGRYREARKLIMEALQVLPGDSSAEEISHLIDAYAAISEGKYGMAKAVLAEGIIINPGSHEMINLMKRIDKFMNIVEEKEQ
ncbi:MAG: hypothetical protein U9O97_06010 [Elusimicrobiota bacterium]|nr:hypothetical protein [Elusimicrobiota bacterium]